MTSSQERDRALRVFAQETERTLLLLAWHIERAFTDTEARYELTGQLDNLRRAIRSVETVTQVESLDFAYTPGDRDENGETDIERARRLDDEQEIAE